MSSADNRAQPSMSPRATVNGRDPASSIKVFKAMAMEPGLAL